MRDLDVLNPAHSDLALIGGVEFQAATASGSRWSLGVRYARGINTIYDLQNHALTLLFGYSSAPSREPETSPQRNWPPSGECLSLSARA